MRDVNDQVRYELWGDAEKRCGFGELVERGTVFDRVSDPVWKTAVDMIRDPTWDQAIEEQL